MNCNHFAEKNHICEFSVEDDCTEESPYGLSLEEVRCRTSAEGHCAEEYCTEEVRYRTSLEEISLEEVRYREFRTEETSADEEEDPEVSMFIVQMAFGIIQGIMTPNDIYEGMLKANCGNKDVARYIRDKAKEMSDEYISSVEEAKRYTNVNYRRKASQ